MENQKDLQERKKELSLKLNFQSIERDINEIMLRMIMIQAKIDAIPFEKLKSVKKRVISKLGKIQAAINRRKKFKYDAVAQAEIIMLEDNKKYYKKAKKMIEERIEMGF